MLLTRSTPASRVSTLAPGSVRLLEEDPELGATLAGDQQELAAAAAVAPVVRHECGPWRFVPRADRTALGALILNGFIVVRIEIEGRGHIEVLGEGDVISPWVGMGLELAKPSPASATVVSDLRMAFLDRRFAFRVARWPEIHAAIMQRLILRARYLSLQAAINSLTRTEERLELTFWRLANRFGKVTREGVALDLRLTHRQLAEMIAAQRPSVTVALTRLSADGRILRVNRDRWLLRGPAPAKLFALAAQSGVTASSPPVAA